MKIAPLHEHAWEIEDFISHEESSILLKTIADLSDKDWGLDENGVPKGWLGRHYEPFMKMKLDVETVMNSITVRLEGIFNNYTRIHKVNHLLRALPGQGMGVHRDDIAEQDKVNMFGIVIYINDDYEGGEIIYPEHGLEYKPKARSLVVHKASCPHGVNDVIGTKTRYTMTSFVKGDETTYLIGT